MKGRQPNESRPTDQGPVSTEARSTALPRLAVSQIGRYLLLKLLGEGGMGLVYEAYDPDLDRRVALKLLRPDARADPETSRARLLREAQAMARVSHPNVLPVFDVGLSDGQVFIAMELVEGETLGEWSQSAPRTWQQLLDHFLAAGQGLLAAHQAGLVHRDFKPANVLISRDGRVRVTDFGLALQMMGEPKRPPNTAHGVSWPAERKLGDENLTETGMVMGTPNYMSPEQVVGDELDARSDQFSFCVSLYTALYGKRPFDPHTLQEVARSRRFGEGSDTGLPRLKATHASNPTLKAILEPPSNVKVPTWVRQAVMRGLEIDPSRRFSSMRELLGALSQEKKRQRRQRAFLLGGVLSLGVLAVAGGVYQRLHLCAAAGHPMEDVWGPSTPTQLLSAFQATRLPCAEDMAQRVSQVLEGYATAWRGQSVAACEATRRHGAQTEELLSRREACLDRRRSDLRALINLFRQADRAVVEKSLDAALALPSLQECSDLEALADQQLLPAEPGRRAEIGRLQERLAELKVLVDAGGAPEAKALAESLEAPIAAVQHVPLSAELHFLRGNLKLQASVDADAIPMLKRAVQEAEEARKDRLKIAALTKLFLVEARAHHFSESDDWSALAKATLKRIGGDAALEADVEVNNGQTLLIQGRLQEARAVFEKALTLNQRILPPGHPKLARTTFLLGVTLDDLGDHAQAVEKLTLALTQTEAAVGPLHPDMARRHSRLGVVLRDLGELTQALEHSRVAVRILKATVGEQDPLVGVYTDEVGQCLLGLKRYPEALAVYQEALAIKRKTLPPDAELAQPSYDGIGQSLLAMGKPRDALAPLRKAASFDSSPDDARADSGFALARALWLLGQHAEARLEADKARAGFAKAGQDQRVSEIDAWVAALPGTAPSPAQAAQRRTQPPR